MPTPPTSSRSSFYLEERTSEHCSGSTDLGIDSPPVLVYGARAYSGQAVLCGCDAFLPTPLTDQALAHAAAAFVQFPLDK